MPADPRLAGYLSRAFSHEMGAVQQYLAQAVLCELWGLGDQAAELRRAAQEELEHAEGIVRQMLRLGLAPHATQLAAVRPGRDPIEMIAIGRALEIDAIRLYQEALRYCERVRDEASRGLFEELLRDEEAHLAELDAKLAAAQPGGTRHG